MSPRRSYSTDLSDEEWKILEPLVPNAKPGGRPRAHETRELLNAIFFYVLRGGCAWRLLPHGFFLPWQSAYHYFRAWRLEKAPGSRDPHPPAREATPPGGVGSLPPQRGCYRLPDGQEHPGVGEVVEVL